MRLADYIMQYISDQGVEHIFTLVGGHAMYLNDALARHPRLTPICCQHEQACVIAAEAYGKARGHIGVALVTAGPGATNAITGVAAAYLDSSPLVVLSGQVRQGRSWQNQQVDIIPLVKPITEYAATVIEAKAIIFHLAQAFSCDGPAWLEIPLDVQEADYGPVAD